MERGFLHLYGRQFLVGHLDPGLIRVGIQRRLDMQAGLCLCVPDQVDDHGATQQGLAAPVLRDMVKHPVFNLVPLTRAGREVADRDAQPDRIRQLLQGDLPQPAAVAIAPPRISHHQRRMVSVANGDVLWSMPTLTQPSL
jgi:hypothetical protein